MEKKDKRTTGRISVANLPPEFRIKNPQDFIVEMRTTFLQNARKAKGLILEDVAKKLHMPLAEMSRIESGKVKAEDMMILHELAQLYDIDYYQLLTLFRLAEVKPDSELGMAACHKADIDKETQEKIKDVVMKLRERLNE